MIGVYFETWACPWVAKPEDSALAKIEKPIDIVYLSFVDPGIRYSKSQGNFNGTGLQFSLDFSVVKESIKILKQKGIKVVLAVGGASYGFQNYNPKGVADLMWDLECDGIDLDWEPIDGVKSAAMLGPLIEKTKPFCTGGRLLSIAGFSTGCFDPNGDTYRGMNIPALKSHGDMLDIVNIMAYDAGKNFDVVACYESYRKYFKKHLMVGFEVGQHGWGDGKLTLEEVDKVCNHIKPQNDGCFVWAYFKQGEPSTKQVIEKAASILNGITIPKPPPKEPSHAPCPNCGYVLTIQ